MPNFVFNELTVLGSDGLLQRFAAEQSTSSEHLSFSRLLPSPVFALEVDERRWKVKNWGTKWDAESVTITRTDSGLLYTFFTPWTAPIPWLLAVSTEYPSLQFTLSYHDSAANTAGAISIIAGKQQTVGLLDRHE